MSDITAKSNAKSGLTVSQIAVIGVMTAATCVLAPLSLPIGPVPISLTNLVIYFSLYTLGTMKGTISYLVYLLLGLVGLPVFSGFSGGPAKVAGPTGGYLVGFVFLTVIAGFFVEHFKGKLSFAVLGMVLGTSVCYLFGTIWLSMQLNIGFVAGLGVGVFPYIPGDLVKIAIACIIGPKIRRAVVR